MISDKYRFALQRNKKRAAAVYQMMMVVTILELYSPAIVGDDK
jgi:hypothetical protein